MTPTRIRIVLALFLAGCVAPGPPPVSEGAVQESVARIAARLVQAAELRTDLSSMRVNVHEIRETEPERVLARNSLRRADELQTLREQLENEFMLALSDRLHIIASDLASAPVTASSGEPPSLRQMADSFGATHAIVGEFVQVGENIQVSIRLVEVKSLLIVAAARGTVPVRELEARSHLALPPEPGSVSPESRVASYQEPEVPLTAASRFVSRAEPSVTILPEVSTSSAYSQIRVPPEVRRAQDALAEAQQPLPERTPVRREPVAQDSVAQDPVVQDVRELELAPGPAALRKAPAGEPVASAEQPPRMPPTEVARPEGPATRRLRASGRVVDG